MLLKNCRIIHWLNMTLENKKKSLFYNKYTFNSSNLSVSIRKNKKCKHNYEAKQYKTNIYKEKNKFNKIEKFKKFHLDILHVA